MIEDEEEERNLLPLDLDCCEKCHRLGYETSALDEEKDIMWLCVGEMIKPDNPKDLHEKLNEIRICLIRSDDVNDIVSFEWTPYEASRVSMALTWAVSNYLHRDQPKLEEMKELQQSLSNTHHAQSNENLVDSQSDSATNSKGGGEVKNQRR